MAKQPSCHVITQSHLKPTNHVAHNHITTVAQAQRGIQSLRTRQKREKKRLEASPF